MQDKSAHIIITSLFVVIAFAASAQVNPDERTIKFVAYYKGRPLPELQLEIFQGDNRGLGREQTLSGGTFIFRLDKNIKVLKLKKLSHDSLRFYFPEGGMLDVSENQVYHLFLVNNDFTELSEKKFNAMLEEVFRQQQIWWELKDERLLDQIMQMNKKNYDSILKIGVQAGIEEQQMEIMATIERNKYRAAKVIPLFDATFELFISRASDVRDAFQNYGRNAFYRPEIVQILSEKINSYNEAYEKVAVIKDSILVNVDHYWDFDDAFLVRDFIENQALNQFHKFVILQRNDELIHDITCYNTRLKGRKQRSAIITEINQFVSLLNTEICSLSGKKERIKERLSKLF